ncbi:MULTISPECIES: DUF1659 domain-containing protein [Sporolactobacillus]|uniref:DUF1659 domain-containing protein n=3 Tax=Sporolactobacillus TaxID=2077 RepID=A0A4Y3T5E1_9BACL|nr:MULTISPECIES: DUF1659 domain-containing protein [Sporolactobacillus]KLI02272.1 hypothetical protein SINU_09035 [Sporolactobacillus inulinus CASD]QAA21842.1 DUF1659 domain-containing protein [Sporolactobacillus terrae]QAA24815.1 DUF1659 domain-containing protein [Sporolactobacillus terrae]UAK16640.1 DUF1659 domain-containing protein [Sporolactobacillus terrae]BBN98116.1 hypothetical protein St703_08210 [Sporolactobacillus terrae]
MATSKIIASVFVMNLNGGLDDQGKPVTLSKSFRNIKAEAAPDSLLTIAQKLAPLQQHELISVERNDTTDILA